jgi:tetratricopeptide (TPR) repeat protein
MERCSPCHRPGQIAPFPLLTYDDVKARAERIAEVTAEGIMPPWLPQPGYGSFIGERRLSGAQIETIRRWVEQGAVEGDAAALSATPPPIADWQMGQPDLVVEMPDAYDLAPGHHDVFRNFVIPLSLDASRYVRAVEFQPGNRKVVHHAAVGLDRARLARRLDEQDPEPGYGDRLTDGVQSPAGHYIGWTPGKVPFTPPADMAWRLDRGTDLVVQMHLLPSDRPESIKPKIGLFFTDTPPTRTPVLVKLGSKTIDIPAGDAAYAIRDTYVLPADVDVLTVYPHAHYLARDMKAFATLPDGTTKWLIWIKDWDFNWQDQYRFSEPVFLPRGSTVTMHYAYDNSAQNDRNPHRPPQRVQYGPHSSDEMGDLLLQVVPRSRADAAVLARDQRERDLRANIARGEQLLKTAPDDPEARNWLAASYLVAGRTGEAVAHLSEAIRLRPDYAEAHYNLGSAFQSQGRLADAVRELRRAAALRPDDNRAHLRLANALNASGSFGEALRHYQRTLALDPDSAEAHNNLGVALGSQGRRAEAIEHFEQALAITPDFAEVHNNLGVLFGSQGKSEQAAAHFRRALELRPDNADAQQNLASLVRRERPGTLNR